MTTKFLTTRKQFLELGAVDQNKVLTKALQAQAESSLIKFYLSTERECRMFGTAVRQFQFFSEYQVSNLTKRDLVGVVDPSVFL